MKFGASEDGTKFSRGIKFGACEAELPLECVTKEAPYKDFTVGETKFGRAHNRPQGKRGLPLEYDSKEALTREHEVLSQVSQRDGMKCGRAYDLHSVRPELFELATKEFPTEGREEVLLPKGFTTAPPSTLLELRFSPK
ncbi:hypothetical protein COCNU_14G000220 [Cocos nucifera]|uniref:Uncharacterized protein n=1 Tax=Cocos nucifera TaxID=13894 RepID=A0A8K0NBK5_COCNU|nr:hypothetical protein COCNU_14G000220 [Cocos nucifera]